MTVVEKPLKTYVWHFKHQNTCYIKGAKAQKKKKVHASSKSLTL